MRKKCVARYVEYNLRMSENALKWSVKIIKSMFNEIQILL